MVLVCHALRGLLPEITHILRDGSLETNAEAERRLLRGMGLEGGAGIPHIVEQAYRRQADRIAYTGEEAVEAPREAAPMNLNLL
jgi:hypothetical protein